jgi:hypothetical protein
MTEAKSDIKTSLQGVNNFRAFQLDASRKLGFVYGATWLGGITGGILVMVLGWALNQIVPAAKIILEEYYQTHPHAKIQNNVHQSDTERYYADYRTQDSIAGK